MGTRSSKPPKNESQLVAKIIDYLKSLRGCGWTVMYQKNHGSPFSRLGTPDLFVLARRSRPPSTGVMGWDVRFYALEVKLPGGEPTKRQAHELKNWSEAGAVSQCVRSVDDVRQLIEELPVEIPDDTKKTIW